MSSTSTATADAQPKASAQPRKIPVIEPKAGIVNYAGFTHKSVVFTAPADLTLQDLNDHPEIWSAVQRDRSGLALSEWDEVEVRAKDWIATSRVNWADSGKVVLFDIKRASKPVRDVALYRDENFEVKWAPEGGFCYWRIRDNVRMHSGNWPTAEACKYEMIRREYPVTVS